MQMGVCLPHDVNVFDGTVNDDSREILRISPDQAIAVPQRHCRSSWEDGGLTAAFISREGAHWASWADCLPMVRERHTTVADTMVQGLARDPAPCFSAVRTCVTSLIEAGFEVPSWRVLRASTEAVRPDAPEPSQPKFGWQQKATRWTLSTGQVCPITGEP